MKGTFIDGIREFFSIVDSGIYSLIGTLYNIIVDLANTSIVKEQSISDISNKLYSFIGIFMLFRITFSLITYIINPDSVTDKEKGGSKLITNIVITFALVILCPWGFNKVWEAQRIILDENLLGRIFFESGKMPNSNELYISPDCSTSTEAIIGVNPVTLEKIPSSGEYIAMMTLRPFVQLNDTVKNNYPSDVSTFTSKNYCKSTNIKEMLNASMIKEAKKDYYYIDYNFFISTIIGVIIVLIFAGFCLDAAVRTIKLTFLQIIAPIPIMSNIDPTSSKKGLFNKWLKEVGITWADLFLRLSAIYFAVFLISTIKLDSVGDMKVTVLLILGALMFAKKLPDILKKIFNIDLKGDFSLNPFKKIEKEALGGKLIAGAATGAAAGAIGAATSFRGNGFKDRFKNAGKGLTAGLTGGFKNPNTLKGLGTGMQPYKEIRKKQKEADQQLKEFDDFNHLGKKLVASSLEKNPDGTYKTDENGKLKVNQAKQFKNSEYIDSYNNVSNAKSKLKAAKENSKAANSELQRIISGNLTNEEKSAIQSGATTYNALKEKATAAASKADGAVDKAQGVLDGAKERHKIIQAKYTDDARKEKAMKEYLDRNSSALDPLSSSNVLGDANVSVSNANITMPNQSSQNINSNNANINQNQSSTNQQYTSQYSEIEQKIANKTAEIREKQMERNETTDDNRKDELGSDLSHLTDELHQLKLDRENLNDEYPEDAADYLENVVIDEKKSQKEALEREREALYNTFKTPQASIDNYGQDYATNEEYQKAKTLADLKEQAIKDLESEQRTIRAKANHLREIARSRESQNIVEDNSQENTEELFENDSNTSSQDDIEPLFNSEDASSNADKNNEKSNRKEYLEDEKRKYLEELDEIRKYYNRDVSRYRGNKRYQEIENKIKEIEDELYYL